MKFLKNKSFREYIKTQLFNKEAEVLYVSCEDKKGFIVLEVLYRSTKEKAKFLFKDYNWYTVPDLELLSKTGPLYDRLDHIRERWKNGFYEAIKLENSIHFITQDD